MSTTSRRGSRSAALLLASAAASLTLAPASLAATPVSENSPTAARDCIENGNVWVNVDFSEAETEGGCATEFSTGAEALESAGFKLNLGEGDMNGFVVGINDVIPVWDETQTYWGSWNGTVNEDETITYEYYQVGAFESQPKPGTIEAWSVGDGNQQPNLQEILEASAGNTTLWLIAGAIATILAVVAIIVVVRRVLSSRSMDEGTTRTGDPQ